MMQDNKRTYEDIIRRDAMNGFVMEEEDNLLQDSMCAPAEITRQTASIDKNSERRRL